MLTRKFINNFILFWGIIQFFSCLTAGTHGSIKAYDFPVPKKILQKAVEKVIAESNDIRKDTTRNYIINITNGKSDTIINSHYNDDQNYITIQIGNEKSGSGIKEYTFQYVGSKEEWDTSKNSSLSIAYAYDENGKGGSNEDVGISLKPLLKRKLTSFFESNFVDRIKSELNEK